MESKILYQNGDRKFILIFDSGEEVVRQLKNFAEEQSLSAAHFTAIGGFERAMLGFFEMQRKEYKKIHIAEQTEVLSLMGDVAVKGDERVIHAHVVLGKSDGTAHGGHLMEAIVRPTLEIILIESPKSLARRIDEKTGLALIQL